METTPKIENIEDIKLLVNSFYDKVRQDSMLKDIFNERIKDQWPKHLEKMYRFWQTLLLEEHTYYGSPFAPHANMPVDAEHFERWIKLFTETVDELFSGEVADEAKWRAGKMAEMFNYKIQYFRDSNEKPIQ
ncbi:MAG: group III truncated hemoglobin [Bacteroidota bacterium]